jgi:hypothetical protein
MVCTAVAGLRLAAGTTVETENSQAINICHEHAASYSYNACRWYTGYRG